VQVVVGEQQAPLEVEEALEEQLGQLGQLGQLEQLEQLRRLE